MSLCPCLRLVNSLRMASTVLAGSTSDLLEFPGPLIQGEKVLPSWSHHCKRWWDGRMYLGRYVLSECDWPTNRHHDVEEHQHCRLLSFARQFWIKSLFCSISIGMVFSRKEVTGQTVRLVSPSVLSLLAIPFCISSRFQIKQEHSGTIHITVGSIMATNRRALM